MSMSANGKRLSMLTLQLHNEWQQAREAWMDSKSQEFQSHFIEELKAYVDRAVGVIEDMDKLVSKVRHDCE